MKTSDLPLSLRAKLPPRQGSHYPALAGKAARPFSLELRLKTVNPLNKREHWATRAKRAKNERYVTGMWLKVRSAFTPFPALPATVTLTRLAPRVMDSDGLAASFKAVRDGVQDAYGVDDGSDLFRWEYRQEKSKTYAVRIDIAGREGGAS